MSVELFPMPQLGIDGGDAVGICVPFKNANEKTWLELKRILKLLKSTFQCDVYDLYSGEKLGMFNIGSFRKSLLTK
ncbi:MAG TPA: hypothetical protein VGB63_16260 [Pedobacter sp.]